MGTAALVCQRWSAVVYSPKLLQDVRAFIGNLYAGAPEAALEQGWSLLRMLLWQGAAEPPAHLEQLHSFGLHLVIPSSCDLRQAAELTATAESCLAACCRCAPRLRSLAFGQSRYWVNDGVDELADIALGSWVQHLPRSLQHIRLGYGGYCLTFFQPLCPWLESLALRVDGLNLRPMAQALPPSLTRLEIDALGASPGSGVFQVKIELLLEWIAAHAGSHHPCRR